MKEKNFWNIKIKLITLILLTNSTFLFSYGENMVDGDFLDSDDSTYLACVAGKKKPNSYKPAYSLDSLLNKTIKPLLTKKNLKKIENQFKIKKKRSPEFLLSDGNKTLNISDFDNEFDFVGFKIDELNEVTNRINICKKVIGENSYACNKYTSQLGQYTGTAEYRHDYKDSDVSGSYKSSDIIFREDLIYRDYDFRNHISLGTLQSDAHYYQCYISSFDELIAMESIYQEYIKPLNDEYNSYINDFKKLTAEKKSSKKNKI